MATRFYGALSVTGGTTAGDIATIAYNNLADGDMCVTCNGTNIYFHVFDDDNAGAESVPRIITPNDAQAGDNGRWVLQSLYIEDLTLVVDDLTVGDDAAIGGTLTVTGDIIGSAATFTGTVEAASLTVTGIATVASIDVAAGEIDDTVIGANVAAAITGTTIDATTDFTVGSLVITDGVLTDSTGISLAATVGVTGQLSVTDAASVGSDLTVTGDIRGNGIINTPIGAATPTTIVGTTIDAQTDFTVGGLVISDALISDDGILDINAVTQVNFQSGGIVTIGSVDSQRGELRLYPGATTVGGYLRLYVGPDSDANTDRFDLNVIGSDLNIGPDNDTDLFQILGGVTPTAKFNAAVDVDAALTATTVDADTDFTVGGLVITDGYITDDGTLYLKHANGGAVSIVPAAADNDVNLYVGSGETYAGTIWLGSDNTGIGSTGGRIISFVAEDSDGNGTDYFIQQVTADDFHIGADNDTSMLQFLGGAAPSIVISAGWTAAGETCADLGTVTTADINDGTIDGVTIGGAVAATITAAVINGSLTWGAAQDFGDYALTNVNIDSGSITGATLNSNVINAGLTWSAAQDFSDQNLTNVNIDSGSISGATINSNVVNAGLTWSAAQDFGDQNLTNVNIDSGSISAATVNSLVMASAGQITYSYEPTSDETAQGLIVSGTTDTNAYGAMGLVYLNSGDGNWDTADKDATSTSAVMLGMALGTVGSVSILLQGVARDDSWAWTAGEKVYLGDAGAATDATGVAAFATDDVVVCIGHALTDDSIYFNPSPDYLEIG